METTSIFGPIEQDIPLVADKLQELAIARHPLLGETLAHVFRSGGKRIRPGLVLLSGKLGNYRRDHLVTLAASLEVVHTATLVHDDTIDEALTRRGLKTVSAVWNPKVAILVGDYLFAQSAELAARLDSVRIMSLLSETVMDMSGGELRQYASARDRTVDEADYLERIAGKTASLFAMCCAGAAIVSSQSEARVEALRSYGENLGMAFQIFDDVLDFTGDEATLGKPAGSDLRQGTITLPAIIFADSLGENSRLKQDLIAGRNAGDVVDAIADSDAVERARQRAEEYARAAREALGEFPASDAKDALLHLTTYVIGRQR